MPPARARRVVRRLRAAPLVRRKAKDLLRVSRLPALRSIADIPCRIADLAQA